MRFLQQLNLFYNHFLNRLIRDPQKYLYLPLGAYWIILFIATSIPTIPMPRIFDAQDKFEHFIAYFILGSLLTLSLAVQNRVSAIKRRFALFSFLIVLCYAAVDELHQLLIPGRYCDFLDWSADVIGGVIGILTIKFLLKNKLGSA